jgi:predicted transposase YdaD
MAKRDKEKKEKPQHDSGYKRLFTHPKMVQDLLRSLIGAPWVEDLDFEKLEDAANSLIGEGLQRREGDMVLRISWKTGSDAVYLTLLLEFQSSPDKWMIVRALQYLALIYDGLIRRRMVQDKLPPVLVIVLYNGAEPWAHPTALADLIGLPQGSTLWAFQPALRLRLLDERHIAPADLPEGLTAVVVGSEQAGTPDEFRRLLRALQALLSEEDQSLWRDLMTWWWKVLSVAHSVPMPPLPDSPTEIQLMIENRFKAWEEDVRQQSLQEGRQQGLQEGIQKGFQHGLQEGLQEGRQEGRQEGAVEGRREALRQMLTQAYAARFGETPHEVKAAIDAANEAALQAWFPRVIVAPQDEVLALLLGQSQS